MDATERRDFVKLLRAASVGGALLGASVLGPLVGLIRNHGLRGFVLVEIGLGGVIVLAIVTRRMMARFSSAPELPRGQGPGNA